jgi:plastocyanin
MTRGQNGTRSGASGRRLVPICMCLFYSIMSGIFVTHCARALASSPARGDTITVQINGTAQAPGFFPDFLTLHVNDTVVFINQALPSSKYAISADDGSFASPVIAPGGRWSYTFVDKGAHVYRETTYPQHMVGELLVVDSAVRLLPTPNPFAEATFNCQKRWG